MSAKKTSDKQLNVSTNKVLLRFLNVSVPSEDEKITLSKVCLMFSL